MPIQSIKTVLPFIYCYSTPGVAYHDGWVKIGYTEQKSATDRILQQTKTAGIRIKEEWREFAVYKDGSMLTFTDDDFKAYLDTKGVNHTNTFGEDGESIGDEWYEISPEKAHEYFGEFCQKPSIEKKLRTYHLREEQKTAVEKTAEIVKSGQDHEYLWNAKPRFGKCLACYDFICNIAAKKVLVVTNRPVVVTSWYDDYTKFMGRESGYFFVSHLNDVKGKPLVIDYPEYASDMQKRQTDGNDPMGILYFVSLQDIKSSIYFGGDYEKLKEISTVPWDAMVVDESHEGVDTWKTDTAFERIHRSFTLYLSGTPFKAIRDEKFDTGSIYNWTYVDEQEAKMCWDGDGTNPYLQMPQLHMMTYRLANIIGEESPDLSDDDAVPESRLNEFFRTELRKNANGKMVPQFVYDADVDRFLDAIANDEKYPFGSESSRTQLKHTFWLLYRVDSARALAEKLKKHPLFSRYEIILAAGDGKTDENEKASKSAYQAVTSAISAHDRTITLSVGQLTTGVTIPQWTGVMMLSERNSAAEYMQASFRVQNPYIFHSKNQMTGRIEHCRKTDAYVFDFNPEHTLDIVEQFANNLYSETANGKGDDTERRRNIEQLLKYLPVTGEDDSGEMSLLDAEQVMIIPRKMRSKEVIRRGFMCDMLFQNISNVFHVSDNAKSIIDKLPVTDGHGTKQSPLSITQEDAEEMHLDENGEVSISDEEAEREAEKNIPEPARQNMVSDITKVVQAAASGVNPERKGQERKTERESIESAYTAAAQGTVIQKLEQLHPDMTSSTKRKILRNVEENTKKIVEQHHSAYTINTQTRIAEIQNAVPENASEEEKQKAEEQIRQVQQDEKEQFENGITGSIEDMVCDSIRDGEKEIMAAEAGKKKDGKLDEFRKHLKGFTRTIPSFLMAYGDADFRLDNLETKIPADVFEEVTSITLDEFKVLRDDCRYFDAVVFNDSVKEFLKKRDELADYFADGSEEDIFDYIPPQKTNQIFTPKQVVMKMCDMLESENHGCFDDPENTFIDPYMKSGLYVTEIVKRLFRSQEMKTYFPDDTERLQWIFSSQVYGLAPTKIIYAIAMHYIFWFADKDGMNIDKSHFRMFDSLKAAQDGTFVDEMKRMFPDAK